MKNRNELFEQIVLPHLNSAHNLARWLAQNQSDAEDIVQEAFLRALRSFHKFVPGSDARPWILTIVRNCCRTWRRQRSQNILETHHDLQFAVEPCLDPEGVLIKTADSERLRQILHELPMDYREVLILRELEELSYKEIGQIAGIPLGTVMSRISRARKELSMRLCSFARGRML